MLLLIDSPLRQKGGGALRLHLSSPRRARGNELFVARVFYDVNRNPDLSDAENLVGLNAEPPARVRHAVVNGATRILCRVRPVHWLKKEMVEG